jgi:hypothetical protein
MPEQLVGAVNEVNDHDAALHCFPLRID